MSIDIAIVNWNTSAGAIAAASAYLESEGVDTDVTIMDNASSAEQRQLLEDDCPPGIRLELSGKNLGYGGAANQALARGTGEVVCVSNADVVPEPDALARLAQVVRGDPRAGMVGPVFGGDTDSYHARLPGATAMLGRIFRGSFMRGAITSPGPAETKEVWQPSGACFAMRREVWEEVGGFDEGFFLWYEDVDLAKRLQDAGYRSLVAGSARARHTGARSFAQVDPQRQQAIRLASVRRYIRKHHRAAAPLAAPLLRISARCRAGGKIGAEP